MAFPLESIGNSAKKLPEKKKSWLDLDDVQDS